MYPQLVETALESAKIHGFRKSCLDEVGRVLSVFGGFAPGAKFAEIGTGCAVGSAWILSGMSCDSVLYTVEFDPVIASYAREVLSVVDNVRVIEGDWKEILTYGPFDFVFVDAKPAKCEEYTLLINAVAMNGMIIIDDLTPEEYWPDDWKGKPDPVRERWLNDDRVSCVELRTSERNSIIIARRVK